MQWSWERGNEKVLNFCHEFKVLLWWNFLFFFSTSFYLVLFKRSLFTQINRIQRDISLLNLASRKRCTIRKFNLFYLFTPGCDCADTLQVTTYATFSTRFPENYSLVLIYNQGETTSSKAPFLRTQYKGREFRIRALNQKRTSEKWTSSPQPWISILTFFSPRNILSFLSLPYLLRKSHAGYIQP